jgi:hypothetical protein
MVRIFWRASLAMMGPIPQPGAVVIWTGIAAILLTH